MWKEILPPDVQALGAGLAERAAREREAGHTIYPPQEQIFRALELTPPEKVKVCLVGQDPYHEAGQERAVFFSKPWCAVSSVAQEHLQGAGQ